MSEKNKPIILVTGASSGLGAAICQRLLKESYTVYGTSRKWRTGDSSDGVITLNMDLNDRKSVEDAITFVAEKEGRLDVLINNAGIGIQGPAEALSTEVAKSAFNTNLFGAHEVTKACLPLMRTQQAGRLIFISSIAANMGLMHRSFYSAGKAALNRYCEALQQELTDWNIKVICVEPGDFKSNIAASRLRPTEVETAYVSSYERCIAKLAEQMEHAPPPKHIADLVVKLVRSKNPRFKYRVGKPMEKLAVHLSYWLPDRFFLWLLRNFSE